MPAGQWREVADGVRRADAPFRADQELWLKLHADKVRLLDKATGRAL